MSSAVCCIVVAPNNELRTYDKEEKNCFPPWEETLPCMKWRKTDTSYRLWAWCRWRRSSLSLCSLTHFQTPHWSDCSAQSTVMSRSCYALTGRHPAPQTRCPSLTQPRPLTHFCNTGWSSRRSALQPLILMCSTGCCWLGRCWLWRGPVLSGGTGSRGYQDAWPVQAANLRDRNREKWT